MSKLPKLQHPTFEVTLPSTGKRVKFRPFTGREQKILLVAKESSDTRDMLRAVAQVVGECFSMDATVIPMFDLEFMFLALRAKSVNNKITVNVKDDTDGQRYEATLSLDDVEYTPGSGGSSFEVAPGVGIKMRYPTVASVLATPPGKLDEWDMLAASVESVWSGDEVTSASDFSPEEMKEWLTGLPLTAMTPIREFFDKRPTVSMSADYTRKDGTRVSKRVTGLNDFFG
jgi:hypothetical protein